MEDYADNWFVLLPCVPLHGLLYGVVGGGAEKLERGMVVLDLGYHISMCVKRCMIPRGCNFIMLLFGQGKGL